MLIHIFSSIVVPIYVHLDTAVLLQVYNELFATPLQQSTTIPTITEVNPSIPSTIVNITAIDV